MLRFSSGIPDFNVQRQRYDAEATRRRLLGDTAFMNSPVVPFLNKPLEARWLYWEPLHKL